MQLNLFGAVIAAAAGPNPFVSPADRCGLPAVCGDQVQKAAAAFSEDRQQVGQAVVAVPAVAEHQRHRRSRADAGPEELVPVGGQLQQRGDLGVAGQFGVVDGVSRGTAVVVLGLDQEIGPTMEIAVEEGGLEHHVRAGLQRRNGFGMLGPQVGAGVTAGLGDLHHAGAERFAELLQHPVFVHIAQRRGALKHLVPAEVRHRGAAQLLVQLAQQLVLALGGGDQVGGRIDQVPVSPGSVGVEQKHGASLHKYGSCQPGRRRGPPNDIPPPSGACRQVKNYQPVRTVSEGCAGVAAKGARCAPNPSPVAAREAGRCAACYAM